MRYIVLVLLLTGCAADHTAPRLTEVDSRPFLSDAISIENYAPLDIAPLSKATSIKDAAVKFDAERRAYRKSTLSLDQALSAQTLVSQHLKGALKATEIEQRATERMLIRTDEAFKQEQKTAKVSDFFHRVIEAALAIAVGVGL